MACLKVSFWGIQNFLTCQLVTKYVIEAKVRCSATMVSLVTKQPHYILFYPQLTHSTLNCPCSKMKCDTLECLLENKTSKGGANEKVQAIYI
jgi:hypothetical protein